MVLAGNEHNFEIGFFCICDGFETGDRVHGWMGAGMPCAGSGVGVMSEREGEVCQEFWLPGPCLGDDRSIAVSVFAHLEMAGDAHPLAGG